MEKRQLGANGPLVSALGLGCMGMSMGYGTRDDAQSILTLEKSIELGITFFDTADMYGWGHNEQLIGPILKKVRDKIILATKMGFKKNGDGFVLDGSPSYIKEACEKSLRNLKIDVIDLYYLHRVSPHTPIEVSIEALAELVKEGKIRYIGISEVKPETIRRAAKIHPICAVQTEYSLWQRDPEKEILSTCRELGIGFVAYCPLGRGFLTGTIEQDNSYVESDFRNFLPRFQGENFQENKKVLSKFKEFSEFKGVSPSQLALAWLLAQGKDIVPIPGTKNIAYLEDNIKALHISLSKDDIETLNTIFVMGCAKGEKYPHPHELES
ncbi:MAG: aldo/keto reductase [Proteobacteria bacterium]|nr:aldo/keto reductase [Pseudomonadota bacterium]